MPNGALRVYEYAGHGALVPLAFTDYASADASPESGRHYTVFTDPVGQPLQIEDAKRQLIWFDSAPLPPSASSTADSRPTLRPHRGPPRQSARVQPPLARPLLRPRDGAPLQPLPLLRPRARPLPTDRPPRLRGQPDEPLRVSREPAHRRRRPRFDTSGPQQPQFAQHRWRQ